MTKSLPRVITTLLKFVSKDTTSEPLCGILFDRRNGVMVACDRLKALFVKCGDPFQYANILAAAKGLPQVSMAAATDYMARTTRHDTETSVEFTPNSFKFTDGLPDCVCIAKVGKTWKYVPSTVCPYPSIFDAIPFGHHSDLYTKKAYYRADTMTDAINAVEAFSKKPVKLYTSYDDPTSPLIHYADVGKMNIALVIMPCRMPADYVPNQPDAVDIEKPGDVAVVQPGGAPDASLVKPWTDISKW